LPTYNGRDGPRKASDDEVARAIFNGGGGVFRWRSGSRNSSGSDDDGGLLLQAAVRCEKIRFDGSAVARLGINGSSMVEGKGTRGVLLFIGEKRGIITYAPGSLSLTDSVEFELDFFFE
jgi:hypothetical protein